MQGDKWDNCWLREPWRNSMWHEPWIELWTLQRGRRSGRWGYIAAGVGEGCTEVTVQVARVTYADLHLCRHCQPKWPQEVLKISRRPRALLGSMMVYGNASCMQLGACLLITQTIASGADQLLISLAIFTKKYSEDQVEYTCVCHVVLTAAAARYILSRKRISTKQHLLLCRGRKSVCGILRSGLISSKMIRGMLRECWTRCAIGDRRNSIERHTNSLEEAA